MSTINLEQEILRENTSVLASEQKHLDEQAKLDAEVEKVLATADATYLESIMSELGFDYKLAEAQRISQERVTFSKLPQNRIMSLGAIRSTCIKYGLRFLPTRFYKGSLDAGIGPKLEEFRQAMGGKLPTIQGIEVLQAPQLNNPVGRDKTQMYIAAPSASFALQPMPRDPLLFCRLSLDKFFLLHKWGSDLRTADVRKGEIDTFNWNSPFSTASDQRAANNSIGNLMVTTGGGRIQLSTDFAGTTSQFFSTGGTGSTATWGST